MEMKVIALPLCLAMAACASSKRFVASCVTDVYVEDFETREPDSCRASDVDLSHSQAEAFFKRAKVLDYRTMVDNYPIAPCFIAGTLRYKGVPCHWEIYAGRTGSIRFRDHEWYFACDTCDDLFTPRKDGSR